MKKVLLTITLLFLSNILYANQFIVTDITKDSPITFRPGISYLDGKCSFDWGGLKMWPIEEFFQGASSYKVVTSPNPPYVDKCVSIEVDIVGKKVDLPYVNQDAFILSDNPPVLNTSRVTTASTPLVGSIFTVKENNLEANETIISAGIYGTPNYFFCVLPTDGLTLKWLQMAGIEDEISKPYVLSMSWRLSERTCADISMKIDQRLLSEPVVTPPPIQCKEGCVPAP